MKLAFALVALLLGSANADVRTLRGVVSDKLADAPPANLHIPQPFGSSGTESGALHSFDDSTSIATNGIITTNGDDVDEDEKDMPEQALVFDIMAFRCRDKGTGRFVQTKLCLEFDKRVNRCRNKVTGRFVKSKMCIVFDKDASRCRNLHTGKFLKTEVCVKKHCTKKMGCRCRDRLTGRFLPSDVCKNFD